MGARRLAGLVLLSTLCWAPAAAQVPRLALTETLRLDSDAEDFPVVTSAITGPRGIIAVLLMADNQVRLYDSTGKRIGAIGRKGAGPGEFERPIHYGWVGDTLWVYDSSHRRFTFIGTDARLIRTLQLADALNSGPNPVEVGGLMSFSPTARRSDGSIVGLASFLTGRTPEGLTDAASFIASATAAGAVARLAPRPDNAHAFASVRRGGSEYASAVPFAYQAQVAYARDGNRFGILALDSVSRAGGTWSVKVITTDGATAFARSFPFTGIPIPSRVRDSAISFRGTLAARNNSPEVAREIESIARRLMPPVYPPISSLYLGTDGTTWVTQRRTDEGVVAVVLDTRGNPVATVLVPERTRLAEVSLGTIIGIESDDDGLTSVVRYRVSRR
jgi:hypothetical protein